MGFGKYFIEINRGFSIFSLWFLEKKKQYMVIEFFYSLQLEFLY